MKALAARASAFALVSAFAVLASAQPRLRPASPSAPPSTGPASTSAVPGNIRAHVGADIIARLLRSSDPDERLRGIDRAATLGTAEAVALLVQATEGSPVVRSDSRALIALARGLARFADQERARTALFLVVGAGNPGIAGRLPAGRPSGDALSLEEGDPVARTELARQIAAIALARSGEARAFEQLYGLTRTGGSGQNAAILALTMFPPREAGFYGSAGASLPPNAVRMLGQIGDLRALDVLQAAAKSTDVSVRCAALVALAELGDARAIGLSRTAIAESDARLRAAAGEAFVLLNAPERFKAVSALVSDEATVHIGVHLAERVFNAEITKLLAARVVDHPDRELRSSVVRALGRSPEPAAATALSDPRLLADPTLGYEAAVALARSPAPNAGELVSTMAAGKSAPLGVRAYVVRALMRGETTSAGDAVVAKLLQSSDVKQRSLGVFAKVALGGAPAESFLGDANPRVRRAAVMGGLAHPSRSQERALLARIPKEPDAIARQLLAAGLVSGDPEAELTTTLLVDRAEAGGADAPLAALALTRRADENNTRRVGQLLGAKDAVVRAHAARGLAAATLPDASGRLAEAYEFETDATVRRAIVTALAARTRDATSPARRTTLENAAQLDPDGACRQIARRGLDPNMAAIGPASTAEAAWLRITLDSGAGPGEPFVGSIVRSDGLAIPVAFDEEGFAIVPGLPPGESRLVLAPRVPTYKAP